MSNKKDILNELLNDMAEKSNTIDLNAYALGLKHMQIALKNMESSSRVIDRRSKAIKIIHKLDQYARSVNSVEYGLPIDPDIPDYDNDRGKDMVHIITAILDGL